MYQYKYSNILNEDGRSFSQTITLMKIYFWIMRGHSLSDLFWINFSRGEIFQKICDKRCRRKDLYAVLYHGILRTGLGYIVQSGFCGRRARWRPRFWRMKFATTTWHIAIFVIFWGNVQMGNIKTFLAPLPRRHNIKIIVTGIKWQISLQFNIYIWINILENYKAYTKSTILSKLCTS